jgi:hypothetical protein
MKDATVFIIARNVHSCLVILQERSVSCFTIVIYKKYANVIVIARNLHSCVLILQDRGVSYLQRKGL